MYHKKVLPRDRKRRTARSIASPGRWVPLSYPGGGGGESLLASGLTGATPEKGPGTRGYVPVNRHTHTYENITSSHTSYAGGKYVQNVQKKVTKRSNYTQYVILKVTKTLTLHDEVQTFAFGMKPIQSARIHNNILTFFFFFFFFGWGGRGGGGGDDHHIWSQNGPHFIRTGIGHPQCEWTYNNISNDVTNICGGCHLLVTFFSCWFPSIYTPPISSSSSSNFSSCFNVSGSAALSPTGIPISDNNSFCSPHNFDGFSVKMKVNCTFGSKKKLSILLAVFVQETLSEFYSGSVWL